MSLIFDDIKITDVDDNEHTCRVCIDEYIPPLPATMSEPAQREAVEWTFCDENGRFIMPSFEISDRECLRVEELLIQKIRDLRNGGDI